MTEQSLALQLADSADACQLTVHDCFLVAKELRRLHDLLGKANALARIRANKIDELEQQLTKTEAQLGESVWNYGELKREQLANQQKTSGLPVVLELHCICGAEWEWRNCDWELVSTPPAALVQEPVAYINVEQRKLEWAKYMKWETPTVVHLPKIPLYTTPQPQQAQKQEPWVWQQSPIKTQWGDDMVVADLAIDKDHTVSVYCERDQTARVEAMFNRGC